jgi:hypothetical protein
MVSHQFQACLRSRDAAAPSVAPRHHTCAANLLLTHPERGAAVVARKVSADPCWRISARSDAAREVRHRLPPAARVGLSATSAGQSRFRRLAVRCPRRRISAAFPRTFAVSRIPAMRLCHDRTPDPGKLRDGGAGIDAPIRHVGAMSTIAPHLAAVQYAGPVPPAAATVTVLWTIYKLASKIRLGELTRLRI